MEQPRRIKTFAGLAMLAALCLQQTGCGNRQLDHSPRQSAQGKENATISLNSVRFDTTGWTLKERAKDTLAWEHAAPDYLILQYIPSPPDISALDDVKQLRDYYRKSANSEGGGVVSVDVLETRINGSRIPYVRSIFKIPQQPTGMGYIGTLTFPFAGFSFELRVVSREDGMTGMREAVIGGEMMKSGVVTIDPKTMSIQGWNRDPYDPTVKGPVLRNLSEDERYDARFPDHPLSRTRAILADAMKTLKFDDAVLTSAPFRPTQH